MGPGMPSLSDQLTDYQAEYTALQAALLTVAQSVTKDGVIVQNPAWDKMTKRKDELVQIIARITAMQSGVQNRYAERQIVGTGKRFPTSSGVGTWPLT